MTPRVIFANSMSDRFHKDIERVFIDRVSGAVEHAKRHVDRLPAKRGSLTRNCIRERYADAAATRHFRMAVSVWDAAHVSWIGPLGEIESEARFVSFEPVIGPADDFDLRAAMPTWLAESVGVCLAHG